MNFVWPWVSRRAYDAKCEQLAFLEGLLRVEQDRGAAIVDRMVELKKEGFMPTPVAPTYDLPTLDPTISDQIHAVAGERRALVMQLTRYAMAETARGTPPAQIIHAIRYGDTAA